MSRSITDLTKKPAGRRALIIGLVGAALGIAAVFLLSNGEPATAKSCPAQPEAAKTLDVAAQGELAALLPTAEGRGYSDLAFTDQDGNPLTLDAIDGTPMLVNFWATWCVPCREEMPALDALSAAYDQTDFRVIPINLDMGAGGMEKAKAFFESEELRNLPLYADSSFKAFERLKTSGVAIGLPATLLLDENGCELGVLPGPAEWNSEDAHRVIEALISLKN